MLTHQAPAPKRHIARAAVRGGIAGGIAGTVAYYLVRILIPVLYFAAIGLFMLAAFVGFAMWASHQPAGGPPLIESTR